MSYKKPQTPLQHKDGDYFYPLTTIDQIIMEDGITRLNGADLVSVNTDGAPEGETARINADTLGGYPADEYVRHNDDKFIGVTPKAGFIYPLATSVVPSGFLLCDGAEYSRGEYPELFAAIGTVYGEGDGSTTFNVPDLQTRVPVGEGEGYELGSVGGEEKHTLNTDEMPNHNHIQTGVNAYSNSPVRLDMQNDGNIVIYDASGVLWSTNTSSTTGSSQYRAVKIGVDGNTGDRGGSQPHNNMQPYTVVNYIIATGKDTGVSVHDIITGAQALPLGIEYGGIGATNAADARRNLEITPENIGAMKMELLWENASPDSDFAAQTTTVDLSSYPFIKIEFGHYRNESTSMFEYAVEDGKFAFAFVVEGTESFHRLARKFIIHKDSIIWYEGYQTEVLTITETPTVNNGRMVPHKIYGIKGVSA